VATDRHQIIRLISQLSHVEESIRRGARRRLVELGPQAVELLAVGLRALDSDKLRPVVGVLAEIGDDRALLPLMRYVFDTRHRPEDSRCRGLAMQAIIDMANAKNEAKLFDFLVDMRHDPDEFVRTYVVECFAKLSDARALDHIRDAFSDPSNFVRERAQHAFVDVQKNQNINPLDLCGEDFFRELINAKGSRLRELEQLLGQRNDAFELASALVRQDADHTMLGLQVLHDLGRPAARDVALRHFKLTRSDADRAASLRLMAKFLHADARPQEVRTITQGLAHADKFIQLAALEAAGRSGHDQLTRRAARATRADDSTVAATAAEALSQVADRLPAGIADELLKSVEATRHSRRYEPQRNLVQCESYLLRALSRALSPQDSRAPTAQQVALASLRDSQQYRAIVATSLEVLERLTPERGYARGERWHPADAAALVVLLSHDDPSVQRRALEVIRRGAPGDTPNLCHEFERLMHAEPAMICEAVIPAILETAGPMAREQLAQLSVAEQSDIRRAARAALHRMRGNATHADAAFKHSVDSAPDELKS
jgi:HEAT repeat protein